jgi:hypothetical protein
MTCASNNINQQDLQLRYKAEWKFKIYPLKWQNNLNKFKMGKLHHWFVPNRAISSLFSKLPRVTPFIFVSYHHNFQGTENSRHGSLQQ